MKKLGKMLAVAFLAITASCVFVGCNLQKDVGIDSIVILSDKAIVEIYEGEFDEAKIQAKVVYEDGTSETVTITEDMVMSIQDGPQWYDNPGTYAITVLFKGETVDLTVKVLPKTITVKFYNAQGQVIDTQVIRKGAAVTAPNDGFEIEGMQFIGWDRSLTDLTEDTDIYPCYANVTALDIESNFWRYRLVEPNSGSLGTEIYEFYKFENGYVYHYQGTAASLLYADVVEKAEYTAIYSSKMNDKFFGTWTISYRVNNEEKVTLCYDGEKIYLPKDSGNIYFDYTLDAKYALKLNTWYKWVIETTENEGGNNTTTYGYIRLTSNAKMEYYKGTSKPNNETKVDILNYNAYIMQYEQMYDMIFLLTEETSSIQPLQINCGKESAVQVGSSSVKLIEA